MLKFALNSRRPPATTSALTKRNITLTFSGAVDVRQSVLGDYFIKGPVSLTSYSPAATGTGVNARNGAMINPSDKWTHGYDGRVNQAGGAAYSDALNKGIGLPRTLNPGDSLVVVVSRYPDVDWDGLEAYDGGNKRAIAEAEIFHVVDTLPPTNAFRPAYCGTTKTIFTTDDVNYSLLGQFTAPLTPTGSAWDFTGSKNGLIGPYLDHCGKISTDANGLIAYNWEHDYPADRGEVYNRVAAYTMCPFSDRNTMANRLIQIGIDLQGATTQDNWTWRGGAGYAVSRLLPILYAGKLLNDATMLTPPGTTANPKFGEQSSWYYTSAPYAGYNYPAQEWPNGYPLYGDIDAPVGGTYGSNHTSRDPHSYFNAVGVGSRYPYTDATCTHMALAGAYLWRSTPVMAGASMVSRFLGVTSNWNADASHDFVDWWMTDDTLRIPDLAGYSIGDFYRDRMISGGGEGFMLGMWTNHI